MPKLHSSRQVIAALEGNGFDFISQPYVVWKIKHEPRKGGLFADYILEISEFRAQTLATDPEDFQNFETFSLAMIDLDYNRDVFRLSRVFWGEEVIEAAGGLEKAELLELRIPEEEFTGKEMMIVLCDRYGNEKSLLLKRGDFGGTSSSGPKRHAKKASRAK